MSRKRMISPEFWRDEKVGRLDYMSRLLFIGLWTFADDNGVGRANDLLLKVDIFPYDVTLRATQIRTSLEKIAGMGMITLYTCSGEDYYHVTNFKKHQKVDKPTPSTLPLPNSQGVKKEPLGERSGSTPGVLGEPIKEEKRKEIKLREEKIREEKTEDIYTQDPKNACITLPLNDKTEYPLFQKDAGEWEKLYPNVDIMQQLRCMKGWLEANPDRRKTKSGIRRFIVNWLSREQDKGSVQYRQKKSGAAAPASLRNEFEPEELERLAWERSQK